MSTERSEPNDSTGLSTVADAADENFCSAGPGTFRVAYGESGLITQSTDRTPFECTCTPLPPVEL